MSFYNVFNEEVTQEGILEDLISYYQELGENGKTQISDFSVGSEVRTLLEVMSHLAYNIREEQNETLSNHFINTAEGEYLDLLGANPNVNLPRIQGTIATGLVKFSLEEPTLSERIIPAETTVVSTDSEYITVEDGVISVGESYTYIPVECVIDGTEGNCKAGEIYECELPEYIVGNDEDFVDGADFEEDEEYRTRLLEYIREDNFGSRGYYENVLLSIEGVHDILVNTGGSASIDYWINCNSASLNESALMEAITTFNDNNNFIVGQSHNFQSSQVNTVSFTVHVNADCGIPGDSIQDLFYCYFHGGELQDIPYIPMGLNMGNVPSKADLITLLSDTFREITSASIDNILVNDVGKTDFEFTTSDSNHSCFDLESRSSVSVVFDG